MKRLKHGLSQVWRTSHHSEVTTMFRWAKCRLHSRLRCLGPCGGMTPQLWVSCQVQSHQHCWAQRWPCQMTGRHQLLRDEGHCSSSLEGAGDRGGEQEFPHCVLSVLITTRHDGCTPFYNSSFPGGPCSPTGTVVFYILLWLCAAGFSPRISCGHNRNGAGREAEVRSRAASLLLQLGNPVRS